MNKCFNGLTVVNVELTSKCNRNCFMCGRRKVEREHPELMNYGDMKFELVEKIAEQLSPCILIQFHSDGEPTLYPRLYDALQLFKKQIRQFDTNARLIVDRNEDIIDNLDVLTISVIENDPEGNEQYEIVKQFLDLKGDKKPTMVYRLLGNVDHRQRWEKLPGLIANRTLHHPMGSFKYRKVPTVSEHGICLDGLSHMVIDRFGFVYPCVRFNPHKYGKLGDANKTSLIDIWNSNQRKQLVNNLVMQRRDLNEICKKTNCEFYGVATSD